MTICDRELLARIANKDESAMEAFYNQYHKLVYRFTLNRMYRAEDAAEVLNCVMFEVWRTAHRFIGYSKVKTWLLGITKFKIIDSLRKTVKHEGYEVTEIQADESMLSALDMLAQSERMVVFNKALSKLGEKHRQVIYLTFFEERTYVEISQIVGCPVGTVKTRMVRARYILKHELNHYLMLPEGKSD